MASPAVSVSGDEALAAGLRKAGKAQDRAAAKASRDTAAKVRGWTRAAAQAGTPQQRHMAGGIGSKGSKASATLTVKNTKGAPGAQGAFYGAKQYPQFPGWVGNSWAVATRGQGPQPINDELASRQADIEALYLDLHAKALFDAVPARPKG